MPDALEERAGLTTAKRWRLRSDRVRRVPPGIQIRENGLELWGDERELGLRVTRHALHKLSAYV
jgi:hypothetical protein